MTISDLHKTCPRCGETLLAAGGFYKNARMKDGYTSWCRACIRATEAERQAARTPEQKHAKNVADNERRRSTPEARAKLAAYMRAWTKRNHDRVREKSNERVRRHRSEAKVSDPERFRMHNQISNNHARAKKLGRASAFHYSDWLDVLTAFDRRCAYCNAPAALLDLDHLVAIAAGGDNVVGNIVPACRPCNAQKFKKPLARFAGERGLSQIDLDHIHARALGRVPT